MGCGSIAGLPRYPFVHLGEERHRESKVSFPRTQHNFPGQDPNPDPLDPESSVLASHEATAPPNMVEWVEHTTCGVTEVVGSNPA